MVIGHVGRMDKGKNQLFLLDVFAKYIKNNLDARLVMVGDGEDYLKITNKIKELRLEDYVLLLGVRQDINQLYSMFDVFVFPSLYEGLGIVLIEAQVNGLTCLTSDTVPRTTKISNGIKYLPLNDIEGWVKELKNIKSNNHQLKYKKLFNNYDKKKLVNK